MNFAVRDPFLAIRLAVQVSLYGSSSLFLNFVLGIVSRPIELRHEGSPFKVKFKLFECV